MLPLAEASQLLGWSAAGGQSMTAGPSTTAGGQLASTSAADLISEDWWLRFSDYRLEDYYAVQARLDNDAGRPFPTVTVNALPDPVEVKSAVYGENFFSTHRLYLPPSRVKTSRGGSRKNIWGAGPLIIWEATKTNYKCTILH